MNKQIEDILNQKGEKISHSELIEILQSLQLISGQQVEDVLIADMWRMLANNQEETTSKSELKKLLKQIIGLSNSDPEGKELRHRFQVLKRNRFNSGLKQRQNRCSESAESKFTFSPKISTISTNLAEAARQKLSQAYLSFSQSETSLSNSQSLPDLLYCSKIVQDE